MTHDGFKKMLLGGAVAGLLSVSASAGVPVNNLQGVGGVAFNPLAYLAGLAWEDKQQAPLCGAVRKPQIGAWYIDLSDASALVRCIFDTEIGFRDDASGEPRVMVPATSRPWRVLARCWSRAATAG